MIQTVNPYTGLPSYTSSRIGTGSDYLQIGYNGTLTLAGNATVWEDLVASATGFVVSGTGVSINGAEQRIEFLASATLSDYAWTSYQLRHAWKIGSPLKLHLHAEQTSAAIPNWLVQYRWQRNSYSKTTPWTSMKCKTPVFSYTSGTIIQIFYGASITPPANAGLSDILQVRVLRDTTNASGLFGTADPAAGTQSIISSDIHLELDALGSDQEYMK